MRALVVGSLPPPYTDRSRSLLKEVLRLRREGAEVEVVSPRKNTVAHRYLELKGPSAGLEAGLSMRKADIVVVEIAEGFPVPRRATRPGRAAGLSSLRAALVAARGEVVLRLHSLDDLAYGVGGRAAIGLWERADRIEVGDEETRRALTEVLGESSGKISLAEVGDDLGPRKPRDETLSGDASLEDVSGVVRARAAACRGALLHDEGRSPHEQLPGFEWLPRQGLGVPEFANPPGSPMAAGSRYGRAARSVLYAAESNGITRPLARTARLTRSILRQL